MITLRPSTYPASSRPWRNVAASSEKTAADPPLRKPTTGIDGPCARAANGHAATPPTSAMNSRRLIVAPRGQNHAPHRLTAVWVLEWAKGDANCDQLFWSGNVGSGSHDRVKTGKAQNQQMLSALPPKADLPADLRTTPSASSSRTPPSRPRASARSRADQTATRSPRQVPQIYGCLGVR